MSASIKRLPTATGWWAQKRRVGAAVQFSYVEMVTNDEGDPRPVIWDAVTDQFVDVPTRPLVEWYGPLDLPWPEG